MSDEAPPTLTPAVTAAKSSKAVLGLLLLNLGGTGFVAFKLLTAHPAAAGAPGAPHAAAAALAGEAMGPIVALDPFVVNLDEPGTSRYLKVAIQVEVAPKTEDVLAKSKELVRDAVLSHLSGLHLKDTLGTEAKDRLRQDLVAKINKLLGPGKVRRMFFQDFVVQ
jgi:flagellar FliL protein